MIIDCISDLHGFYPKLEGGDLLIVAGDLTARDHPKQHLKFLSWFSEQNYKKKILIAGNHDNFLRNCSYIAAIIENGIEYLCDSGTEFEGLKIWGSPWTKTFPGMNPHCKAFTVNNEEELTEKWALIPEDTDILITHSPPYSILDEVGEGNYVGSTSLYDRLYSERIRPKLHVFGHIHESYGHIPKMLDMPKTQFVNACHVNERYKSVNKPIRIIL